MKEKALLQAEQRTAKKKKTVPKDSLCERANSHQQSKMPDEKVTQQHKKVNMK